MSIGENLLSQPTQLGTAKSSWFATSFNKPSILGIVFFPAVSSPGAIKNILDGKPNIKYTKN